MESFSLMMSTSESC